MAGFMIAAPASGSGKTMIVCGLLTLLGRKGRKPWAFKCGPDYIDGLFHRQVLSVEGGNLDSFFETPEQLREKYRRAAAAHLVVTEGVMGYFDGLGGVETAASSWEIAGFLDLPVVLVVDARGASVSFAALIQGFLSYRQGGKDGRNQIAAVLFNRISPMMYPRMKELVERETGVPVIGYLPPLEFLSVGSRHLGLILPEEISGLREQMERLADRMEETVDWQRLLQLAGDEPAAEAGNGREEHVCGAVSRAPEFRLGVARDEAFCFYYRDNLEALEAAGAQLVYFSPLHDPVLPENLQGILLGGGYPENYGAQLAANRSLREQIAAAARQGMPMLAECGGYLYLLEELEGADGAVYPMAGVFHGRGVKRDRLGRFGYITLRPREETLYFKPGEEIRGHEFHYWDCADHGDRCRLEAVKPVGGRSWPCMRTAGRVMAGFPHLYYPSCPSFVRRFARSCREYS